MIRKGETTRAGKLWNENQDLIGQGLAKIASGFSGGINSASGYTLNFDVDRLTSGGANNSAMTFGSTTNGLQIGQNVQINVTGNTAATGDRGIGPAQHQAIAGDDQAGAAGQIDDAGGGG